MTETKELSETDPGEPEGVPIKDKPENWSQEYTIREEEKYEVEAATSFPNRRGGGDDCFLFRKFLNKV